MSLSTYAGPKPAPSEDIVDTAVAADCSISGLADDSVLNLGQPCGSVEFRNIAIGLLTRTKTA